MLNWNRKTLVRVKLSILLLSFLSACSQDKAVNILFERRGYTFPYQLNAPVQSWNLPAELVEISGLSFIDKERLACVQDEMGVIYIFNLKAGEIESKIDFGENGDYEGIEIIENDAWVLKSNGTLFEVTGYLDKTGSSAKKYATALSGKNDTEGLAYDPVSNNLLIACKENPYVDEKDGKGLKAIYSFNTVSRQIGAVPFLLISIDTIRHYKGDVNFKPSGIAIQPGTGHVFILGAAGRLLLVLSGKGEMLAMTELSPVLFRQPEGICFSPDGILYISNEGAGRGGTILEFEPKNK